MIDNLYTGKEARDGIIKGIKRCASAVGGTMGTSGYNAIIQAIEQPGHFATNDGATILESIRFADPLEEMGRKILLEAVKRANKQSGDGSSTTTVLCAAIIEEGLKQLDKASPLEIKRSLESCIPLIEESINKQKREITVNEVGQVASISAEDEKIGAMIQEIYQQIGKDGIIHWDISKTFEDNYTIGKE
jgi:chaperonin GroEL